MFICYFMYCNLLFPICTLSSVCLMSALDCAVRTCSSFQSAASIQTALMGKIDISFFPHICPFFSRSSATKVTAERRLGGRWCHLLISWRPISQQTDHVTGFCLDLSAHLPSLLAALSNKWRCKKETNARSSDLIFFDWEQSVFLGAVSHRARPTSFWCAAQKWYKLHFAPVKYNKRWAWWRTYSFISMEF